MQLSGLGNISCFLTPHLIGGTKAQHLPWPVVESVPNLLYVGLGHRFEVGALGEVLTDQAIGILIESSLPGMIGVGEIDLRLQRLSDVLMSGKLLAVVGGDGMGVFLVRFQQPRQQQPEHLL